MGGTYTKLNFGLERMSPPLACKLREMCFFLVMLLVSALVMATPFAGGQIKDWPLF